MIKHVPSLLLGCFFILISITSFGQIKDYKQMMLDNNYNFYEVVEAADKYFEINGTGKGSGFKGYQRWKNENESKYYPSGVRNNVDHYAPFKAYQEILRGIPKVRNKGQFDDGWEELGPWDANNITKHYSPGIGRVESFWINPNNPNHMFLGSRSGGFWKTTDGGTNWKNTTDFLVASGVRSIAVNPFNIEEILISVQQGGNGYSHGIYRSTDGGENWNVSKFNPTILDWGGLGDNEQIFKIAYHPTKENQVFIGASKGLFVSNDNLESWKLELGSWTLDVDFHPTDTNIIYAYRYTTSDVDYIKISTDGGETFTSSAKIEGNNEAKGFIAVSAAQPDFVYFASNRGLWKSINKGATFTFLTNPNENCEGFAVSDLDTNNIVYGYVDTEVSTDGGYTFSQKTRWSKQDSAYVHADIRTAECINGVFYLGTDGYLARSEDNGTTWTTLNDGTSIREFYAVGLSQSNNKVHMAGSQDNGTSILNENGWIEWNGGDGMEALIQPLNDQWMLGSWQYGSRQKTIDGGIGRFGTGNPRRGSGKANWEAPFLLNPLDQMVVYHFADTMFRGTNFGSEWEILSSPQIGQVVDAAIAENDSNIIVISRYSTIRLTTDGGESWTNIANGLPGFYITDLAFDPKNDSTILLTYNRYNDDSHKVYMTNDLGQTWKNITYNLSNMPLRTIVMDVSDSSYIYVGGEIGVYYKSLADTVWTLYNENLPNVTVKDLEIHHGSNTLKAATWGRGLWETTLVGKNDFPAITNVGITNTPTQNAPKEGLEQFVKATIEYDGNLSFAEVKWSVNNLNLNNSILMQNTSGSEWETIAPISAMDEGDKIYFKVVAVSQNLEFSETYRFQYTITPFVYCDAEGSESTTADYINYVELNGMINTSNQEFYGDFTDSIISLTLNEEYTLTVKMNYHWEKDTTAGWIDFNGDAEFSNNEQIVMSILDGDHKSFGTFTVPNNAKTNKPLRMRVRNQYWEDTPVPCGKYVGEVEDYTVIIEGEPVSIQNKIGKVNFSITPNPTNGAFTIQLSENAKDVKVSILNIQGKHVFSTTQQNTTKVGINENLKPGVYIVEITTEQGISTKKVVVE
ncbi:MAG: T9SS type A sorting domain-containing protein [Bacteroidia bacterium]|nr:T9SS type A sorting domain-containing protein [Bacteroidia bacterium]